MEKISLLIFALLCVSCVSKQEYQRLEQENIRFKNEIILLQKQVKDFQQQVKQKEWQFIRDEILYTVDADGHVEDSKSGALYVKMLNANAFYEMRLAGTIGTIIRIPIYENPEDSQYADKECNRRFKYKSKTGYYLNIN